MPPSNGERGRLYACGVLALAGICSVVVGIVTCTASNGIEVRLGVLLAVVGVRLSVPTLRRRGSCLFATGPDRRDGATSLLLLSLLFIVGLVGIVVERSSILTIGLELLMMARSFPSLLAELWYARVEQVRVCDEEAQPGPPQGAGRQAGSNSSGRSSKCMVS